VTAEEVEGRLNEVVISGDFFMLPMDAIANLEDTLKGAKIENGDILNKVKNAYSRYNIDSPGVTPEDVETAIKLAFEQK
jgi:lipoate-protein ligase A